MFAVIFKAKISIQDEIYTKTVSHMRELAFEKYGCIDFIALTEGSQEIAISYWEDEKSITNWKKDSEHTLAQKLGQEKWYESYEVEVVQIKRKYSFTKK